MSYVSKLLARNERVVRTAHDHWITLLSIILVDVAISIIIIGLSILGIILSPPWTWLGLALLVIPIGHLTLRFFNWWNKRYIVTNRRIIQIDGVVNTRVSDTSLEKINDIVMEQSALGRMLKFGDLKLISGSESGIDVFHRIADPIGFKKELLDQKATLGNLDIFENRVERVLSTEAPAAGDVPELIAELDELRQRGLITEEEFAEKRQQLLDTI
jgi:uncharacterized membrane protein YdbT with pleckstrin-like domain